MAELSVIRALFTKQVLRDFEMHLSSRTGRVFEHDGHPYTSLKGLMLTFVEASPPLDAEPARFDLVVKREAQTSSFEGATTYVASSGKAKTVAFEDLEGDSVVLPQMVLGWVGRLREAHEHEAPGLLSELEKLLHK